MTPESSAWLPLNFAEWMPITQASTLGLATFVQEDVPTITAALLAGGGRLAWSAGFFGCFLGIWLGDALLYLLARGFGRPLLRFGWAQRLATPESVARSEQWFAERGAWLLVSSRFVPGTRLPTYLAAGFLRLPFSRFLLVTGSAVAVWTLAIFGLAHIFGAQLTGWMQRWNHGAWLLPVIVIAAVAGLHFIRRLERINHARRFGATVGRWRRWEFWPPWLFYLPVAGRYLLLALKYRGVSLPSAANPGIVTGGLVGESKFATLRELFRTSPEVTAEAWFLPASESKTWNSTFEIEARLASLRRLCAKHHIAFPLVLKPDLGQRGLGVKLIQSFEEADAYLRHTRAAVVVQRYAAGPGEVGIFYYRFPHEAHGQIFAVTEKIFPTLTGDGVHTIEELIWKDPRARFVADRYLTRFAVRRREVLAPGETLRLVEAGNHAQGCIFRDGSRLLTPELAQRIDEISQRLPGFFIGRYDLRFGSEDDLRAGRNFQILELNGASAEATSIYDARNSLWAAYRTLFRQWELVFAIGAANRSRGARSTSIPELWRAWRNAKRLFASYPLAD
ncbi:MAG TPA: VTT domain-containing protein [Verrucomicrobiota bacterium]|nr:VTT domain-containing protein [Verrucomicrobiota bacterium]